MRRRCIPQSKRCTQFANQRRNDDGNNNPIYSRISICRAIYQQRQEQV